MRPARYAIFDTGSPQSAQIQFAPRGSGGFTTVQTVLVGDPDNCYFDVRIGFPSSGTVRLAYTYPPVGASPLGRDDGVQPLGCGHGPVAARLHWACQAISRTAVSDTPASTPSGLSQSPMSSPSDGSPIERDRK